MSFQKMWNHNFCYYRSSTNIDIQGRYFKVPSFTPAQKAIPFSRVNHNKYIITDKAALIGTSNWTPDYFLKTGGIGFVFSSEVTSDTNDRSCETKSNGQFKHDISSEEKRANVTAVKNMHCQLCHVFWRDWDSPYASENLWSSWFYIAINHIIFTLFIQF